MVIEEVITDEIKSWSNQALEKINPNFAGLLSGNWPEDKVGIGFKTCPSFQDLTTIVSTWDDKHELVVLVDLDYIQDREVFYQHVDGLNEGISHGIFIEKDLWLMGVHPDDDPKKMVYGHDDLLSVLDHSYAMIFVQRLSKLHEASEKLKKTGYYQKHADQFGLMDMLRVRETYYRRLKNGS